MKQGKIDAGSVCERRPKASRTSSSIRSVAPNLRAGARTSMDELS